MKVYFPSLALITVFIMASCQSGNPDSTTASSTDSSINTDSSAKTASIKEEEVSIAADTTQMQCFAAYDDNKKGARPIVLILPEWWGLNEYPKYRARKLAELGYFALAVDIYGNGRIGTDPEQAQALAKGFYSNPKLATSRILAALDKAKTYSQADSTKTAAIGYCFGGSMVLNAARLGAPLNAVVSFHGGLAGVTPKKNTIKSKILVCHGDADKFESPEEIAQFKKQLDSVGAPYTFKVYPAATHAFTNPESTENGKKFKMPISYNAEADKNSWNDMQEFFTSVFK